MQIDRWARAAGAVRAVRRQAGFALLELSLALALSAMVLIWASGKLVQDIEDSAARSSGVWLLEIKRALDQMLLRRFDHLAAGGALPDPTRPYAELLAPTVAELKRQAHLPAGFPELAALGMGAQVQIVRGAACPGPACRLDALVYTDKPLLQAASGLPDLMRMAALLGAAGGYGGAVWMDAPARLRGANFDFPNPLIPGLPVLPTGTLALWSGLDSAAHERYVRMQDARNPDLRGDLSVAGQMRSGGRLGSGEYLALEAVAVAGDWCGQAGLFSRNAQGELLSCRNRVWTADISRFGGAYSTNNRYGCAHYSGVSTANPQTGNCSCPSGFAAVIVSAGGIWKETEGWTTGFICVR